MDRARRPLRIVFAAAVITGLCLVSGCGGQKTYRLSGKVTFKGQPIPAGKIYFIPDGAKGNKGQTGFADIKDGAYDTAAVGGQAVTPGAVTVAIEGIDLNAKPDKADKADTSGESVAKALFPRYEIAAELPKDNSTKDFEVPADAATAKPKQGGDLVTP